MASVTTKEGAVVSGSPSFIAAYKERNPNLFPSYGSSLTPISVTVSSPTGGSVTVPVSATSSVDSTRDGGVRVVETATGETTVYSSSGKVVSSSVSPEASKVQVVDVVTPSGFKA